MCERCVTDMDVYTPLATDGSHEHQEQILYTRASRADSVYICSWLETG